MQTLALGFSVGFNSSLPWATASLHPTESGFVIGMEDKAVWSVPAYSKLTSFSRMVSVSKCHKYTSSFFFFSCMYVCMCVHMLKSEHTHRQHVYWDQRTTFGVFPFVCFSYCLLLHLPGSILSNFWQSCLHLGTHHRSCRIVDVISCVQFCMGS